MHIAIQFGLILSALKWGDWKNWRRYYPSILFLVIGDLLYNFITYNYALWIFEPVTFDKYIYRNHTLITLGIDFLGFPALVLMYLTHYPKGKLKQVVYVLAWSLFNTTIELLSFRFLTGISYHHGWNLSWSFLLNILLYASVRIHYKNPLWAWILFWSAVVFFVLWFNIPLSILK